ncbi:Inner membrane protein alx [Lacunisphaera limnophila]|uniref:Inner membrane protein alx n=1 Tax=Lacunisphaera limnophila TaxID=1838286 RepID=A0A1D8ASW9_9BACT|nr:TerC family protein [Lacunisphaera limnophila]AOS43998.1 Inner membrane protein alx [Lacunisphaera limnophila]
MTYISLFPFADYWWFYGLFTLFVLGMLALDLGVFHRDAHVVGFKEALGWSVFWISLALVFGYGLYQYGLYKFPLDPRLAGLDHAALARQTGLEYLTGFVVEKSLSVDNIFVFVVIFTYFGVPAKYQHRVLFYGILGALIFRIIFISLGAALMQFHWVIWLFGGFLILTGLKILFAPEKPMDPEKNPVIRLLRKLVPVTPNLHGQSFLTKIDGVWHATPLFVCLVFMELTDIVFAVDSVPAIFALTKEPLIVFTSNVFAILGLRALFFLLAGVMHKFRFLKYGLGLILVFVGLKMVWLNEAFGGKFPITWSLGIIGALLTASIVASLAIPVRSAPAKS